MQIVFKGCEVMKLFILLPSYNEEEALPCLLESIYDTVHMKYHDLEVIVVNDGSIDNTAAVANSWGEKLKIKVISHSRNMGLGEAVNTGIAYFNESSEDEDIAVIMDADNTHSPLHIPYMIQKIGQGFDTVIASRYQDGGREEGVSFLRRLCSLAANLLLRLCFSIPNVMDYTCGFRAYSGRAIKRAYKAYGGSLVEEKGFTCMAELLIKLYFIGCSISEIPLVLRYDLKKGKSKMKVIKTIRRYFILILNLRRYRRILSKEPVFADGKEK